MGDQYIKVDGAWVKATRPYIKRNDVWTSVRSTWVKSGGAWVQSWAYDSTPPSVPVISLSAYTGRYINVGVRLPDAANDPGLRRIRLHVSYTGYPSSQFGSGYSNTPGQPYLDEGWSDFWYNGQNPKKPTASHPDSSVVVGKYWPPAVTSATNLPGGQYYYFSAWAEDMDNNWSMGQFNRVWMPKDGVAASKTLTKQMEVRPINAGSMDGAGVYTEGALTVNNSPVSAGAFFYNTDVVDSIGQNGTPTITRAQIRLSRANDSGNAIANVRVFRHWKTPAQYIPDDGNRAEQAVIGTIQKGEAKWFDLPPAWLNDYNTGFYGVGLQYGPNSADYLVVNDLATDSRCGELSISWTEAL